MTRLVLAGLAFTFVACSSGQPTDRYGFITRLGNDTVSIESVVRSGNTLTI